MAYTIVKSDGTVLTSIADGTINTTSTSVGLPGRNYAGYGQTLDTNFVHQIESYAAATPPSNPLRGQLWYNTNANTLNVCPADGTSNTLAWLALTSTSSGGATTFGAVTVTGNVQANNLSATNFCNAATGVFNNISVAANANIATGNITSGVIGTLNTTTITTGGAALPGSATGTWTVNGTAAGNALIATGGNVYASVGIKCDNYMWANGVAFNTVGSYSNANVTAYLPTYTGTLQPSSVTTSAIAGGGTISGIWTLAVGATLQATTAITVAGANVTGIVANATYAVIAGSANAVAGANVTGTVANATYATIAGTANAVAGANVSGTVAFATYASTAGAVAGANVTGTVANATYAATAGSTTTAITAGTVTTAAQGNITSAANLVSIGYLTSLSTAVITTGANTTPGTITGAWTLTTGSRLNATYADLAERFEADAVYDAGTVVELGGTKEVTSVVADLSDNVFGVVSHSAAYLMNSGAGSDSTHPAIAMSGRVQVKVSGKIKKGDRLVSAGLGRARAAVIGEATAFNTIGRSLVNKTNIGDGTVEAIVTIKG